jgi:FkbM family methyltransferase
MVREEVEAAQNGLKYLPADMSISILGNPLFSDEIHRKFASYVTAESRSGYTVSYLNVATDTRFANWPEGVGGILDVCSYPESFLEESAVLTSVLDAGPVFRMMELGAGWGRWAVMGAAAAKLIGKDANLICVEGEKTHFKWMEQHFIDNGLNPKQHKLIEGVVHKKAGEVTFQVFSEGHDNSPDNHYGQYINENAASHNSVRVKAITLNSLLAGSEDIDLIDMDIQGSEFDVLAACDKTLLNGTVKRIYIGTHSRSIEKSLSKLFNNLGWVNILDFKSNSSYSTELGTMSFQDGIQFWVNPKKVKSPIN